MVWMTNPGNTNKKLELNYYSAASGQTIKLLEDFTIDQKDIVQLGGTENTFVCMQEGDYLEAEGATGSDFTIIVSYVESSSVIKGG